MRRGAGRAGVVLAASALVLSGCGGGTVGADSVQQSVRDGLAGQGIDPRSVSCPDGVEASVGESVVCGVELWDEAAFGEPVDRIRVVVTEVSGDQVRYRLEPLAVGVPDDAQPADETAPADGAETDATTGQ